MGLNHSQTSCPGGNENIVEGSLHSPSLTTGLPESCEAMEMEMDIGDECTNHGARFGTAPALDRSGDGLAAGSSRLASCLDTSSTPQQQSLPGSNQCGNVRVAELGGPAGLTARDEDSAIPMLPPNDSSALNAQAGAKAKASVAERTTRECEDCRTWKSREYWHKKQWTKNGRCIECVLLSQRKPKSRQRANRAESVLASKQEPAASVPTVEQKSNAQETKNEPRTALRSSCVRTGTGGTAGREPTVSASSWTHEDTRRVISKGQNQESSTTLAIEYTHKPVGGKRSREEEPTLAAAPTSASQDERHSTCDALVAWVPEVFRAENVKQSATNSSIGMSMCNERMDAGSGAATGTDSEPTSKRNKPNVMERSVQVNPAVNYYQIV